MNIQTINVNGLFTHFEQITKYIKERDPDIVYVHTLNIPSNVYKLKETLLEFRTQLKIWSYRSLKQIYHYKIDREKFKSNIQTEYPYHNWTLIWEHVHKIKKK